MVDLSTRDPITEQTKQWCERTISMTGTLPNMCVLNIDDRFIICWFDFHITEMCPYVLGNDVTRCRYRYVVLRRSC